MSKAKAKSSAIRKTPGPKKIGRTGSHEKAALRSEAFARALTDAKSYANDYPRLRVLFSEAAAKTASVPKDSFKGNWAYLQAMLRLIRAYSGGDYRHASEDALLWIIAALNYLVDPFDLIPDEVPFLGFVDDATVVEFAVSRTRQTLDDFMSWETTAQI